MIKDDAEVLKMFKLALNHQGERSDLGNNVTEVDRVTGNSRAYTLSRLERESPELLQRRPRAPPPIDRKRSQGSG